MPGLKLTFLPGASFIGRVDAHSGLAPPGLAQQNTRLHPAEQTFNPGHTRVDLILWLSSRVLPNSLSLGATGRWDPVPRLALCLQGWGSASISRRYAAIQARRDSSGRGIRFLETES